MDAGGIDLAILDGEAVPAGGMGIARQLKDEIYRCPPMLVLTGRPDDGWLATWSRADAAVPHPIDPIAPRRGRGPTLARAPTSHDAERGDATAPAAPRPWPHARQHLAGRPAPRCSRGTDLDRRRRPAWAMRADPAGEATAAQIAGFAVALRSQGRDGRRGRGPRRRRCTSSRRRSTSTAGPSTSSAPAATARIRSTSRRWRRSSRPAPACPVVKHGNRAASSACGSADVLEELGVRLDLPPSRSRRSSAEAGITFCFAPVFHPRAAPRRPSPRRELGVPTIFNFLGPLANPARPAAQAVGVADARMAPIIAGVLAPGAASTGSSSAATTGSTSSRPPRRHDGLVDAPTARSSEHRLDPAGLGLRPRVAGRPEGRRRRRTTPTSSAASSQVRPARCATPCCSTPPPRSPPTRPRDGAVGRAHGRGAAAAPGRQSTRARPKRRCRPGSRH